MANSRRACNDSLILTIRYKLLHRPETSVRHLPDRPVRSAEVNGRLKPYFVPYLAH